MIDKDDDEVRAIGFVTIYSSYLESTIHELLVELSGVIEYSGNDFNWTIGRKIDEAIKRLKKLNRSEGLALIELLRNCKKVILKRNEVVHSKVLAKEYNDNNLISIRPGVAPREIDADEIYELAIAIDSLESGILRTLVFRIPAEVAAYVKENTPTYHLSPVRDGHVIWPFTYTFNRKKVTCEHCLELIRQEGLS